MNPAAWTFLGVLVTAVVGFASAVIVKKIDSSTTKTLTPYEALAKRVSDLETDATSTSHQLHAIRNQLQAVTDDRDGVVAYLKSLWSWVISGATPPPPPIPDHLHDVLPPTDYAWPDPPRTYDDTNS